MMLTLLKNDQNNPMGQIYRQKGRFALTKSHKAIPRIISLTAKRKPTVPGSMVRTPVDGFTGFHNTHGIPAVSVPTGHSLENQCSVVIKGRTTIKTINITYGKKIVSLGRVIFTDFILYNTS
jgi:hypothetical protein